MDPGAGAIIELQCESAPVASNEAFVELANDLARQLATGPGATTPEDLLEQPSPTKAPKTLKDQFDELVNQIREAFRLKRLARIDAPCGGYVHHDGGTGVLLQVEGGSAGLAKDISMHVAAMRPSCVSKEDLDPDLVAKEREILSEQARKEGKPENIIGKMVEGRLREFYAQQCLLDQPYVKGEGKNDTVAKVAKAAGMNVVRFYRWEVGKE
jgi:elongation factor Ts